MDKIAEAVGMDPWAIRFVNAYRDGDMKPHQKVVEEAPAPGITEEMRARLGGVCADACAEEYEFSREDQDAFAYWSQMKAAAAQENGRLDKEIIQVTIPQRKKDPIIFSKDEFVKPGTTREILANR